MITMLTNDIMYVLHKKFCLVQIYNDRVNFLSVLWLRSPNDDHFIQHGLRTDCLMSLYIFDPKFHIKPVI